MPKLNETPLDATGRLISPGNFIAYGIRHGNSGALRVGKVRKVNGNKIYVGFVSSDQRIRDSRITNTMTTFPNRMVIIDNPPMDNKIFKFIEDNVKIEE